MFQAVANAAPLDTPPHTLQAVTRRLAVFGISQPLLAAQLQDDDVENIFKRYREDDPQDVISTSLVAKSIARLTIQSIKDGCERSTKVGAGSASTQSVQTSGLHASDVFKGFAYAIKDLHRRRRPNPHRAGDGSGSEDDEFYDVSAHLKRAGLDVGRRPEHMRPHLMNRLQEQQGQADRKGRPYVSPATSELLRHWAPRPSPAFSLDPLRAADRLEQRAKQFEGPVHLLRHLLTWGLSHIAVGAFAHEDFWVFYMHVLEVMDARGFQTGRAYVFARLNQLVSLTEDFVGSEDAAADKVRAKGELRTFLRSCDDHLLQHIQLESQPQRSNQAGGASQHGTKEGGGEARRKICFDHAPHLQKMCGAEKCDNIHLDTLTADGLDRYSRAKLKYDSLADKRGC
jgi:hypothetical protein